ncbi:MAG: hypothetical protein L0Y71_03795 [Gemmataceae bacterium]|nr:hypothetical protein [Gemmataceae bacterium]
MKIIGNQQPSAGQRVAAEAEERHRQFALVSGEEGENVSRTDDAARPVPIDDLDGDASEPTWAWSTGSRADELSAPDWKAD